MAALFVQNILRLGILANSVSIMQVLLGSAWFHHEKLCPYLVPGHLGKGVAPPRQDKLMFG